MRCSTNEGGAATTTTGTKADQAELAALRVQLAVRDRQLADIVPIELVIQDELTHPLAARTST